MCAWQCENCGKTPNKQRDGGFSLFMQKKAKLASAHLVSKAFPLRQHITKSSLKIEKFKNGKMKNKKWLGAKRTDVVICVKICKNHIVKKSYRRP